MTFSEDIGDRRHPNASNTQKMERTTAKIDIAHSYTPQEPKFKLKNLRTKGIKSPIGATHRQLGDIIAKTHPCPIDQNVKTKGALSADRDVNNLQKIQSKKNCYRCRDEASVNDNDATFFFQPGLDVTRKTPPDFPPLSRIPAPRNFWIAEFNQ